MLITKSNVIKDAVPTITNGLSTDRPENITDPDFSTSYGSSNPTRLGMDFGFVANINYVAVAGVNIEGAKDFTSGVLVRDTGTIITANYIERNHCILCTFPTRTFNNLRVELLNPTGNVNPRVHYVSAGQTLSVPNGGENAGYNRQFLQRNFQSKTQLNANSAPVATITKKMQASGRLTIPNSSKAFSEGEWQDFLDFSEEEFFFIQEQQPEPIFVSGERMDYNNNSAYLCYEPKSRITAHSQTRALNAINLSFKVYNGL